MPIFEGSRYEHAELDAVPDRHGVYRVAVRPAFDPEHPVIDAVHRVGGLERLDQIAATAYGDPELWWLLAQGNPQLEYPDEIRVGELLYVPGLTRSTV